MNPRFDLVEGPDVEPVDLAAAKEHAKIEHAHDDGIIPGFIKVARQRVEKATGRTLITQEWTATLAAWPALEEGDRHRRVRLAHFPVQSIDRVTVDDVVIASTYYRLDGKYLLVSTEVDDSEGEIDDTGIVIEFTTGYADAGTDDEFPEDLRNAVLMLTAHYYQGRGATSPQGIYHQPLPEGVAALLEGYKVLEI